MVPDSLRPQLEGVGLGVWKRVRGTNWSPGPAWRDGGYVAGQFTDCLASPSYTPLAQVDSGGWDLRGLGHYLDHPLCLPHELR